MSKICLLLIFILAGCLQKPDSKASEDFTVNYPPYARLTNVAIVNNQLVFTGANLDSVTALTLTDGGAYNENFVVESKSASNLIANSTRNISIAVGGLLSLVVTNAFGASTFTVDFTLADGSVTAAKLAPSGAADGDILVYNQTAGAWQPSTLSGQTYKGTWDANANTPTLSDGGGTTFPNDGDYYVVGTAGATTIDTITPKLF